MNNSSLRTADRLTHLKIVVLSLVAGIAVVGIGLAAHRPGLDMSTQLGDLELTAPVLTASGCAAAGRALDQFFDITQIGAIVTKSVMLQPRSGRATPRMAETPSGMLNSIGLENVGLAAFVAEKARTVWANLQAARTKGD